MGFLALIVLAAGAMADAEADPYYAAYGYAGAYPAAYGAYGAFGAYGAYPYGLGSAAGPALAGGYAGAGRYVANSAGVVHVAKREAEADPYYAAYGYAGLYGGAYPAAYGAYGTYGAYPYGLGYAAGYASVSPSAAVNI